MKGWSGDWNNYVEGISAVEDKPLWKTSLLPLQQIKMIATRGWSWIEGRLTWEISVGSSAMLVQKSFLWMCRFCPNSTAESYSFKAEFGTLTGHYRSIALSHEGSSFLHLTCNLLAFQHLSHQGRTWKQRRIGRRGRRRRLRTLFNGDQSESKVWPWKNPENLWSQY